MDTWIRKSKESIYLFGPTFGGSSVEPQKDDFYLLSTSKREKQFLDLYFAHVNNKGYCWVCKDKPKIEPPFLITKNDNLRVIFNGPITCELTNDIRNSFPKMQSWDYAIKSSSGWFGIIQFRLNGFLKKKEDYNLIAFHHEDIDITSCKIYDGEKSSDIEIGKIGI